MLIECSSCIKYNQTVCKLEELFVKITSKIAIVVSLMACLASQSAWSLWVKVAGSGTDIGIGGRKIWLTGTNKVPGGYGIFHFEAGDWQAVDGGAVAITADSLGRPWVINNKGEIFYRQGNWQKIPGAGRDIAAGGGHNVWIVGTTPVPGGYQILYWKDGNWNVVPGGAVRIAVDSAGNPWVVNNRDEIFRMVDGQWQRLPGLAKDIAIDPDNTPWVIGATPTPGGYSIHRWTGSNWQRVDGGATRIAVDNRGNPWVVNNLGEIFGYQPD